MFTSQITTVFSSCSSFSCSYYQLFSALPVYFNSEAEFLNLASFSCCCFIGSGTSSEQTSMPGFLLALTLTFPVAAGSAQMLGLLNVITSLWHRVGYSFFISVAVTVVVQVWLHCVTDLVFVYFRLQLPRALPLTVPWASLLHSSVWIARQLSVSLHSKHFSS